MKRILYKLFLKYFINDLNHNIINQIHNIEGIVYNSDLNSIDKKQIFGCSKTIRNYIKSISISN
jgi:hypothetical protein